jgi:hypothetical protein
MVLVAQTSRSNPRPPIFFVEHGRFKQFSRKLRFRWYASWSTSPSSIRGVAGYVDSTPAFEERCRVASAPAAALMPSNVQRMLAQQPSPRTSLRNQENRSFYPTTGRFPACAGSKIWTRSSCPTANPFSTSRMRKIPAAICCPSFWIRRPATPKDSLHQPCLSRAARGMEQRTYRSVPARASQAGCREGSLCNGLIQTGGNPVPIRAAESFIICNAYRCPVSSLRGRTGCLMTATIDPDVLNGGLILSNTATGATYRRILNSSSRSKPARHYADRHGRAV